MTVHFVGAGPGAADLITLRGHRLLESADVVIHAGSLVNPALLDAVRPGCRLFDSATMTLDEVVAAMRDAESRCEMTVRLHSGDPSLYGAIHEQMRALDRLGIDYDVCPGVSSFCGAAAALRLEYTVPEVTQSVVITRMPGRTPMSAGESVAGFARHGSTMVIFLSTGLLDALTADLIAGGRGPDDPAAVVYKATWPDERILRCTIGTLCATATEHGITSTALIVVGPCLDVSATVSRLYADDFATGFREAKP
jgi:precorrin-4/cobalt-precorrin-4 C11-methyltransferase